MMTYATIETLHQIKYLQPFAMNIFLFILPSLSFYFMSLTTVLSLLIYRKEVKGKGLGTNLQVSQEIKK